MQQNTLMKPDLYKRISYHVILVLLMSIVLLIIILLESCKKDEEVPLRRTFKVEGRHLKDPCGNTVLLKGVNKMSVFDELDPNGVLYFPEIAKTNANTVRIVWRSTYSNGSASSLTQLEALIQNCMEEQMIPMVEIHDATCNWSALDAVVNYWTQPAMVTLVKKYEHALLVNIANEAGNVEVTATQFRQKYKSAITQLRNAGINTPLFIDATACGKDLDILIPTAQDLIDHDPHHNIMFSVHPYWSKLDIQQNATPGFIEDQLMKAVNGNIPLILGEVCAYGGWPGEDDITESCQEKGSIDYQTILSVCHEQNIGWYLWEWGPGNGFYQFVPPVLCPQMDITTNGKYQSIVDIQPGAPNEWAKDAVITSTHSIKNTAVKSSYLLHNFKCQ